MQEMANARKYAGLVTQIFGADAAPPRRSVELPPDRVDDHALGAAPKPAAWATASTPGGTPDAGTPDAGTPFVSQDREAPLMGLAHATMPEPFRRPARIQAGA